jgi:hypothetical protein
MKGTMRMTQEGLPESTTRVCCSSYHVTGALAKRSRLVVYWWLGS